MAWEFCGVSDWLLQLSPLSVEFGLPRPPHCGQGTPFLPQGIKTSGHGLHDGPYRKASSCYRRAVGMEK